MKKKLYQGFTLIEMMVVLLIISILMLLFIPNLATQREKVSKQGDCMKWNIMKRIPMRSLKS